MKHVICAVFTVLVILSGCVTRQMENTSVKNTVYTLESVKDIPTGVVFSFGDYCAFNAERKLEDSDLDRTLAENDARLELHFYNGTAELKLESGRDDKSGAFLEYQTRYASKFFFTENRNSVELVLSPDNFDEETRISIEAMSAAERDAILKSVFEKSKDTLIEPDEEDNVVNYWVRIR
ncbi:MAG: hypothetical protein LBH18_02155 [Spirochaetaceae bacterium]|nr:hypothetical protein [Spirochaetaceae bacterium]